MNNKKKTVIVLCLFLLAVCAAVIFIYDGTSNPEPSGTLRPIVMSAEPSVSGTPATGAANMNVAQTAPKATATPQAYKGAVIAFTFDDGCLSDYEIAYPILKEYGIRGTSYIIPAYQDQCMQYTMTWDQIREMAKYGWVFGCHTYAHSDLTKMTKDEIAKSMEMVNEAFIREGLDAPVVHAFPYGRYNQDVIDALKPYRKQMRKAFYESNFVNLETVDPFQIDCISADMRTEKRLHEKEQLVDKACEENAVIVFRCHCLYKSEVNDMGEWVVSTDSALFEQLVQYCVRKNCRFITMTELMDMYEG